MRKKDAKKSEIAQNIACSVDFKKSGEMESTMIQWLGPLRGNYFLHNHKDVTDVVAAERLLNISYDMFYGSDVSRNDVESFLKKNVTQKEEIAKV